VLATNSGRISKDSDAYDLIITGGKTFDTSSSIQLGGDEQTEGDVAYGSAQLFVSSDTSKFRIRDRQDLTNIACFYGNGGVNLGQDSDPGAGHLALGNSDRYFYDDSGNTRLACNTTFYAEGNLACGGVKSFVQEYPDDPTREIHYASLEGGEAGTYVRGSGQLVNGEATIALPEHFALVTNEKGLTATVTPLGECNGLWVVRKSPSEIVVKELQHGTSDAKFDFLVQGKRLGYENYQVVRDK
jgi:hypothetical protein